MSGPQQSEVHVFVRCGDRYVPPLSGGPWTVIDLPHDLGSQDLPSAVQRVREGLRGHAAAQLLVAGPVALGIALGQGLAHEPVAIDYLQLNQVTKEFEIWLTNRRNL
ncbi:MAG: hypothetical protein ACRDHY_18180 [Anaerolineales bacterium]